MEFEHLLKIINAVSESNLTGFKYEEKGVKLSLQKEVSGKVVTVENIEAVPAATSVASPASASVTAVSEEPEGQIVRSPLVGRFYAAPSEDAAPFVIVGDQVEKGQILAIVEAMKLMNDIESEYSGRVAEIYVQNGESVEYGQPLFRIE